MKSKLKSKLFFIIFLIVLDSNSIFAETQKTANVLDFEDDVIEGERAAPSLFVQMDIQAPKMDSLMFQRKNFNDFHNIDKFRKPKYRNSDKK